MIDSGQLIQHVIYRSPADYPGMFVVRPWRCTGPGPIPEPLHILAVVPDLKAARLAVPKASDLRLPRSPEDDPSIVEVWL